MVERSDPSAPTPPSGAVSLALSLVPTRRRGPRIAAALTGIASGLAVRFAIIQAGKASSLNPRASFQQQRAAIAAGSD